MLVATPRLCWKSLYRVDPANRASRMMSRLQRTELARTGEDLDRLAVAGLAATAGGAALVLWSADAEAGGAKEVTDAPSDA